MGFYSGGIPNLIKTLVKNIVRFPLLAIVPKFY